MALEPLNLDQLLPAKPSPKVAPAPIAPTPANSRRSWMTTALWFAVVALLAYVLFSGQVVTPGPDPQPDIDVSGRYVLLVVDESRRESVTAQQATVLNSAKLATWCESNDVEYRRYDARDDLGKEAKVWQEMQRIAADLPAMVTLAEGKAKTQPVPAGIDAAITELEKVFK